MSFHTPRLILEQLSLADLDTIHELHLLPASNEFNTRGAPETIRDTELLLNEWMAAQQHSPRTSYIFVMRLAETNQFIGLVALILGKIKYRIAEVWYKTLPDFWKKGYTTEALLKLLEFGFDELGLHRIEAGTAVENIASIKVLEKAGLKREGLRRKLLPIDGKWLDNYLYAILDEEYLNHINRF